MFAFILIVAIFMIIAGLVAISDPYDVFPGVCLILIGIVLFGWLIISGIMFDAHPYIEKYPIITTELGDGRSIQHYVTEDGVQKLDDGFFYDTEKFEAVRRYSAEWSLGIYLDKDYYSIERKEE